MDVPDVAQTDRAPDILLERGPLVQPDDKLLPREQHTVLGDSYPCVFFVFRFPEVLLYSVVPKFCFLVHVIVNRIVESSAQVPHSATKSGRI